MARKRATGFALMDTAFAADPKFLRLARIAPQPADYAAAVGVFWLMLAEARRARSAEVDFEDWAEFEPQIALLKQVGLLCDTGFCGSFDEWAPAYQSPADRRRIRIENDPPADEGLSAATTNDGYAPVRTGTQSTQGNDSLSSLPIGSGQSPLTSESSVGESPTARAREGPSPGSVMSQVELAVRRMLNGGGSERQIETMESLAEQVGETRALDALKRWTDQPIRDRYGGALNELQNEARRRRGVGARPAEVPATTRYDDLILDVDEAPELQSRAPSAATSGPH